MVDAGNYDAPRLCKFYNSWARKGEHSEERPWRRSAIVEAGSGSIVTEAQLRELAPIQDPGPQTAAATDRDLSWLLGFMECYEVALRSKARKVTGGWQIEIECPWSAEHSDETRRDTVVSFIAGQGYGFKCLHSHCVVQRHWPEFRAELKRLHPNKHFSFVEPRGDIVLGDGLPIIAHATLAEAFLRDNHDFVCVYDLPGRPIAQRVKTRWDISKDDIAAVEGRVGLSEGPL